MVVNLYLTFIFIVIDIVDVNKDVSSDFLFCVLNLQSIRGDEATTSKELIFFNALTDVPITSPNTQVEIANSGKTMMFYEIIQAFPKISLDPHFDHSIYRLFEMIPAVLGTLNKRGLTV